jgi:hypothetical protein
MKEIVDPEGRVKLDEDGNLIEEEISSGNAKVKQGKYVGYLFKAVQQLIKANVPLPAMKKTSNTAINFQFRGHAHVMEEIQGYWERHCAKSGWKHRAKVMYRCLYLGLVIILFEEELLEGRDNKEALSKLEILTTMKASKHKVLARMIALRGEIASLVKEVDSGIIKKSEFDQEIREIIDTFDDKKDHTRFSIFTDQIIVEERTKQKNNKYQQDHRARQFELEDKGIRAVGGTDDEE